MAKKQQAIEKVSQVELRMRKQVLLLWAILGEGGGKDVSRPALEKKGMLPDDDKAARDALEAQGFIRVEKRPSRNEKGRLVNSFWISVTDAGRVWAEENLAAPLARSQAAAPILQAWLTRLSGYMSAQGLSLKEVLAQQSRGGDENQTTEATEESSAESALDSTSSLDYGALRDRVRRAYLDVAGEKLNTRVLLSNLRERLKDIDRGSLDKTLSRMHLEEGTTLSGLNNPQEITAAIREGGLTFKGQPMYALWMTK
jgi:hypothetical protein